MTILDGKAISEQYIQHIAEEVLKNNMHPILAIVTDGLDPASAVYIRQKIKAAEKCGIAVLVEKINSSMEYIEVMRRLSADPAINGIIVQQPCKYAPMYKVKETIPAQKDVDGFSPDSYYEPCTPLGIMTILSHYNINIVGKHCVVLGRSEIVGRPLSEMLLKKNATVTVCHSKTPTELRNELLSKADIIFACTGVPNLIKPENVRDDAIIIDVGITRDENGKLCGDAGHPTDWTDTNVMITPVPGGVGPMTVASLMVNTWAATLNQNDN